MDDFFRIPKSLCYLMVKHPALDKNSEPSQPTEKKSKDSYESRYEVGKKFSAAVLDESKEIPEVKKECHSDIKSPREEETTVKESTNLSSTSKKSQKIPETTPSSPVDCSLLVETTLDPSLRKKSRDNSPKRKDFKKKKSSPEIEKLKNSTSSIKCSANLTNDEDVSNVSLDHQEKTITNQEESSKPQAPVSFECETCGRSFPRKSALKVHMVNHSTVKSHKCEVCQKLFKRKSSLTTHVALHSGMKFGCEECDYTTTSRVGVRNHVRRMHRKDFNYKCDECPKSFMSNSELKEHKISHLGIKTFICEFCGKRFLQKSSLSAHNRSVHGVVQKVFKKDHKCEICEKAFTSEYLLQNHVGIHSRKFLCTLCGKEFANNHGLRLHNRMHTGERPYSCQHCAKSFASSNALAVHKLTHTGERPYVCDLCGKSFTQRTTMMTHRKKHPGSHPRPPATQLSKLDRKVESNS